MAKEITHPLAKFFLAEWFQLLVQSMKYFTGAKQGEQIMR
jgi:hypothetical protein